MGVKLTTIAAWAASLGMSRQSGYAAVHRCRIPVEGGKVDPSVATILYRQRTRHRVNPRRMPQPAPRTPTANELVELAEGIADLMTDGQAPDLFDEGLPYLRALLCQMPDELVLRVRLPQRALDALLGDD